MCVDILEIWLGIANRQNLLIFDKSYLPATQCCWDIIILRFYFLVMTIHGDCGTWKLRKKYYIKRDIVNLYMT